MKQMECLLKILNEIPEGDQSGRSIKDTKTPKSKQGLGKLKKQYFFLNVLGKAQNLKLRPLN